MKILYLAYFDVNSERQTGVNKKIKNQVNALRRLGNEVVLAGCKRDFLYLDNGNTIETKPIKYGFSHYRWSVKKALDYDDFDFDLVYIRFPGTIEPFFYLSMKMFCRRGARVILELPTYPIGHELQRLLHDEFKNKKIVSLIIHGNAILIHRILSRRMKRIVSKIVTFMPFSEIWNIQTIQIDNGVDIVSCPIINKSQPSKKNIVRMITVANVSIWHGIDRVILGMKAYYDSKNNQDDDVILTIVGDSPHCKELKLLTEKNNMTDKVIFSGAKFGKELIKEYENADIAIGSLGMHRINVINGSTLKVKEYCSLGIPFIYAYNEKCLSDTFKYALKFSPVDEPIDIGLIIDFYKNLKMNYQCSEEMHQFASENYTWEKQMQNVISSLEE